MKAIPDPGFAGDDGGAEPQLAAALAAYGADRAAAPTERALLDALAGARLLVPVVAILAEEVTGPGGLRREKNTDMAVPTILRPDGRRLLPAFTSLEALVRWRPDARPVPVACDRACQAAYGEGADALAIDIAGPVPYLLGGAPMRAFAEGRSHLPPAEDAQVIEVIRKAVATEPAVHAAYLGSGERADLTLILSPCIDASATVLVEAAQRLAEQLADDELLRARLDGGLDLAVLPPGVVSPVAPFYRRDLTDR
jgi:SseB protein N-terminal domain